tara:strand:+ start:187 stop:480 length:294 start_codon:yes stop_codon:yes gene_type:complete
MRWEWILTDPGAAILKSGSAVVFVDGTISPILDLFDVRLLIIRPPFGRIVDVWLKVCKNTSILILPMEFLQIIYDKLNGTLRVYHAVEKYGRHLIMH